MLFQFEKLPRHRSGLVVLFLLEAGAIENLEGHEREGSNLKNFQDTKSVVQGRGDVQRANISTYNIGWPLRRDPNRVFVGNPYKTEVFF